MHIVGIAKALSGFLAFIGDGASFPLFEIMCDVIKLNVTIGR